MIHLLEINMEYRKGILFVRLSGKLTKNTIKKFQEEVTNRVEKNGIYSIVFNLEELKEIDLKGIHGLFYHYELSRQKKGKICICGIHNNQVGHFIKKSRLLGYFTWIDNELKAFQYVKI